MKERKMDEKKKEKKEDLKTKGRNGILWSAGKKD